MEKLKDNHPAETAPANERVAKIKPAADVPYVPNPAEDGIVGPVEPKPRIPGIADANVPHLPRRVVGVAKPGPTTALDAAAEAARVEQDRAEAETHAETSKKHVQDGAKKLVKMAKGEDEIEVHPSAVDAHKARGWRHRA